MIYVDIDGVLGDFIAPVDAALKADYGVSIPDDVYPELIREFLVKNGIPYIWYKRLLRDEWFWSKIPPFVEDIYALNKLASRYEIHILTSRPKSASIPTHAWLRRHGVRFNSVEYAPAMRRYQLLEKGDVIIEDLFYEAYKCAAFGFKSFVVRRSYNTSFENRVINGLCRFIDGIRELSDDDIGS